MLGIGITSINRPEHLELCFHQIAMHTTVGFKLYIYDQSDCKSSFFDEGVWRACVGGNWVDYKYEHGQRKGIAYAKNMCLYNLRECDNIILLDDDCWPKADGWVEYFINAPYDHLLYLKDRHLQSFDYSDHTEYETEYPACSYLNSTGCFMYLTKEVIEKVGYFNSDFRKYGMEHSGYSQRIYRAGLTPAPYISLDRTSQYIHSLDLDGSFEGFDVPHKPSLSLAEMNEHIEHNRKVFEMECTTGEIYQDFKP